jgi:hypothetical protein
MHEGMPDGSSRVTELPGDLPDGHAIAISSPNRAIVVHGNHILALRAGKSIHVGAFTITEGTGVGPAYALISRMDLKAREDFKDNLSIEPGGDGPTSWRAPALSAPRSLRTSKTPIAPERIRRSDQPAESTDQVVDRPESRVGDKPMSGTTEARIMKCPGPLPRRA